MVNIIEKAIDTLYDKIMEMPNRVLDIFNNFFGEERVDMQGFQSKSDIRHFIETKTLYSIFSKAGMYKELPAKTESRCLLSIDTESLSVDSVELIAKAISSDKFINYCLLLRSPGYILVHFPSTVVTNEYGKSTIIKHLYVKVPITYRGAENGLFTVNRSEYTVAEVLSNYMHSHVSCIPTFDFTEFQSCCLGSGPLNGTQTSLSVGFDEDRWNLFCLELSKYVETESIAGTPYHRLEGISLGSSKVTEYNVIHNSPSIYIDGALKRVVMEFFSYYLDHNNLTFSFRDGVYSLGMPFLEYLIHLSNSFIDWINNKPEYKDYIFIGRLIYEYVIINNTLYYPNNNLGTYIDTIREYIGKRVCTFKGKPVTITISDIENIKDNSNNFVRLLKPSLASAFLNRILRTINYRYGRDQENTNTAFSKVRYKI